MDYEFACTPLPKEEFLSEDGKRHIRRGRDGTITYRGFTILEKRDFGEHGFLIDGMKVTHGYLVTDGQCAIMPGGSWSLTVFDAMTAIDDLIDSQDEPRCTDLNKTHPFWVRRRLRQAAEQHAPELALALHSLFQAYYTRDGDGRADKLSDALSDASDLLKFMSEAIDFRNTIRHPDGRTEKIGSRVSPSLEELAGV